MDLILTIIMGYLFGAIPTALIIGKRSNIDIRKHGSGNIGGTNTFRVLGKKAGFIVAIVDVLKGFIPAAIGYLIGGELMAIFAGFSASIGHSYSIFAGLKGGKSVATSAGVMLVINPISILAGALVFALVLFTTKYVSLSSMLAASTVAITILLMEGSVALKIAGIFFALFIIIRHHSNIKRLLQGTESRAFQKKK